LSEERYRAFREKRRRISAALGGLETRLAPTRGLNARLEALGTQPLAAPVSLGALLRRPEVGYEELRQVAPELPELDREARLQVEVAARYEGYLKRQAEEIEHLRSTEELELPEELDYGSIATLSMEVRQKLGRHRPRTLGQASRISGVTPAAINVLYAHLKRQRRRQAAAGGEPA
jgi:tRNA uridine 5-carboxymethylaminomethyl modification enzyme